MSFCFARSHARLLPTQSMRRAVVPNLGKEGSKRAVEPRLFQTVRDLELAHVSSLVVLSEAFIFAGVRDPREVYLESGRDVARKALLKYLKEFTLVQYKVGYRSPVLGRQFPALLVPGNTRHRMPLGLTEELQFIADAVLVAEEGVSHYVWSLNCSFLLNP